MTKFTAMGKRMFVLFCLFLIFAAYLAYSLYTVQIKRHDELYRKARMKYTTVKRTAGNRGEIFDCDGNLLVGNIPCSDVCADPSLAGDAAKCREIAAFLAKRLKINANDVYEKLMDKEIVSRQKDGTVKVRTRKFVIIKPRVDYEIAERLKLESQKLGYKTVFFRETTKRNYPKNQLLANILGFTNIDRDRIVAVIGLEKFFDKNMKSVQGESRFERSRDGLPLAYGNSQTQKDQDGFNVYLTIREPIQAILEEELDKLMLRCRPRAAYAVMVDPWTGDIIAVAQRPTFNPNDRNSITPEAWRNRIAEDTFEPGSVMKPFIVAGAIDQGIVTPDTRFDCENGLWFYGGKSLKDSHPMGNLTVSEIIQHSSNIGTAKIALLMGNKKVDETIRSFGFGQRTGIPLKPETRGQVRPLSKWKKITISRVSIGQGIEVTPFQLARGYSMLANGGYPVKLRLVDRLENPVTGIVNKLPQEKTLSLFKSPQTHQELLKMLISVTEPGGTARFAAVPGYHTAGKTGTAQKFVGKAYSKKEYIANFAGFVPAHNPRFVLVVCADTPQGGYYGGKVAGPTFRDIAERTLKYMNVKPDYDAEAREKELKAAAKERWLRKQQEQQQQKARNTAPERTVAPVQRPVPAKQTRPDRQRKYRYITFTQKTDRKR